MRQAAPPAIDRHAAENLRFIRDTMARASSFTAVPGWGGVWMGVSALITAALSGPLAETSASSAASNQRWLTFWLVDAAIAVVIGLTAIVVKARRSETALAGPAGRRFALAFLPALIAGLVLTTVFVRDGLTARLPGCWLLLYGAAVTSGGAFSVPVVPLMGVSVMALGLVAFLAPLTWGHILLAVGFGGLHVIFGFIIARKYGG